MKGNGLSLRIIPVANRRLRSVDDNGPSKPWQEWNERDKGRFGSIPIQRVARDQAITVIPRSLDLGVDWLDTANGYTCSESYGEAIKPYARGRLKISPKAARRMIRRFSVHTSCSPWSDCRPITSIYQFHDVSDAFRLQNVRRSLLPVLQELKRQALIRHIGASAHTLDAAMEILEWPEIEGPAVPLSFIVEDISGKVLAKAEEKNVGFIAMKPFGRRDDRGYPPLCPLSPGFPGAAMDPGFENVAEVEEVLGLANTGSGLNDGDKERMTGHRGDPGAHFCRRCQYCSPCPQGVKITNLMTMDSLIKRLPRPGSSTVGSRVRPLSASLCTQCGQCETKCPYRLPIIGTNSGGGRSIPDFRKGPPPRLQVDPCNPV